MSPNSAVTTFYKKHVKFKGTRNNATQCSRLKTRYDKRGSQDLVGVNREQTIIIK